MGLVKGELRGESQGSEESLKTLLEHLEDPSADVRRMAALDLGQMPEAAERLVERFALEPDPAVLAALSISLAQIPSAAVAGRLLALVRGEDASRRCSALDTLRRMPVETLGCLETALEDVDPDVRLLAAGLLGEIPHPRLDLLLVPLLEREQDANVVAAAVESVAKVGTAATLAALEAARARFERDAFLAFAIDEALRCVAAREPD